MLPSKMSSIYILGEQTVLGSGDMLLTCNLSQDLDGDRVISAYESFVRARPLMRMEMRREGSKFLFKEMEQADFEARLSREKKLLRSVQSRDAMVAEHQIAGIRLPFIIIRHSDASLSARVNHELMTGLSVFYWLEDFLQFLQTDTAIPPLPAEASAPAPQGFWAALLGIVTTLAYFVRVMASLNSDKLLDPTRGRRFPSAKASFSSRVREFNQDETSIILANAKAEGLPVTAYVAAVTSDVFLREFSEADRLSISIPVDIGPFIKGFTRERPGNSTGNITMILKRDEDRIASARLQMKLFAHRVPYRLLRMFGAVLGDDGKLLQFVSGEAAKSFREKGALSRLAVAITNTGVQSFSLSPIPVQNLVVGARTQAFFLAIGAINNRSSLALTIADDLFDQDEAFAIFDRIADGLLKQTPT